MADSTSEQILQAYETKQAAYRWFETHLKSLIIQLLQSEDIRIHAVESRTKELSSLRDKLSRPGKAYASLADVTDLCGIRVIVYYKSDVKRVSALLKRELQVDPAQSGDVGERLAPDQFGYKSVHSILSLSTARSSLVEWRNGQDLKAEVQIRTVAQHAWAAISHELHYKLKEEPPADLKRRLARIASFLETVDEDFETLRTEYQALAASITQALKSGNFDLRLNATSATQYLALSKRVAGLRSVAVNAGFEWRELASDGADLDASISEMVALAHVVGYETIANLDEALGLAGPIQIRYLHALSMDNERFVGRSRVGTDPFLVMLVIILMRHQVLTDARLEEIGWDRDTAVRVLKHARECVSPTSISEIPLQDLGNTQV